MKAISLWQPWASWILWRWKPIETRLHQRFAGLRGERIAIHAARRIEQEALSIAALYLTEAQLAQTIALWDSLPRGAIIGTAHVLSHRPLIAADSEKALIDCSPASPQRFGLVLINVKPIEPPINCSGRQGIFSVHIGDEGGRDPDLFGHG